MSPTSQTTGAPSSVRNGSSLLPYQHMKYRPVKRRFRTKFRVPSSPARRRRRAAVRVRSRRRAGPNAGGSEAYGYIRRCWRGPRGEVLRPTLEAAGGGFWHTEVWRPRTTADATRTAKKGGRFRVFYEIRDFGRGQTGGFKRSFGRSLGGTARCLKSVLGPPPRHAGLAANEGSAARADPPNAQSELGASGR